MKTIITFVIVAATVVVCKAANPQLRNKLRGELKACVAQNNINVDDLNSLTNIPMGDVAENAKCFLKCVLERMEFVDSKGMLNDTLTNEKLSTAGSHPEKVIQLINKCKPSGAISDCQIAFDFFDCAKKEIRGAFNKNFFP